MQHVRTDAASAAVSVLVPAAIGLLVLCPISHLAGSARAGKAGEATAGRKSFLLIDDENHMIVLLPPGDERLRNNDFRRLFGNQQRVGIEVLFAQMPRRVRRNGPAHFAGWVRHLTAKPDDGIPDVGQTQHCMAI